MSDAEKLREAMAFALAKAAGWQPEYEWRQWLPNAAAALAAIHAAGFRIVPEVPTEAMIAAADDECNGWRRQPTTAQRHAWTYTAMLAAAAKVLP
jgi:hypothetical protein